MSRKLMAFVAFIGMAALGLAQPTNDRLTQADFARLHRELTAAKEPWQTIPWHVSLLEAQKQAVKENKPVYMLCRAGHPLGCV